MDCDTLFNRSKYPMTSSLTFHLMFYCYCLLSKHSETE